VHGEPGLLLLLLTEYRGDLIVEDSTVFFKE